MLSTSVHSYPAVIVPRTSVPSISAMPRISVDAKPEIAYWSQFPKGQSLVIDLARVCDEYLADPEDEFQDMELLASRQVFQHSTHDENRDPVVEHALKTGDMFWLEIATVIGDYNLQSYAELDKHIDDVWDLLEHISSLRLLVGLRRMEERDAKVALDDPVKKRTIDAHRLAEFGQSFWHQKWIQWYSVSEPQTHRREAMALDFGTEELADMYENTPKSASALQIANERSHFNRVRGCNPVCANPPPSQPIKYQSVKRQLDYSDGEDEREYKRYSPYEFDYEEDDCEEEEY